jgi:hypothetical protein
MAKIKKIILPEQEQENAEKHEPKEKPANEKPAANATPSAESEKKENPADARRNNIFFIIFTAGLILALLAIVLLPKLIYKVQLEKNTYNGFQFVKNADGTWTTVVEKGNQPFQIPFYYHPRELEDIGIESNLRNKFFAVRDNNGSIFITLDPDAGNNTIVIAGVEIARITGERFGLLNVPTHSAFIKKPQNATVDTGTPVVTCNSASNKTMVIWLTLSDKNVAYSQGNCIILEFKSYTDSVKVADRLMYNLLGIMLT